MDAPEEPDFDELGGEEGKESENGEEEPYPQAYPIRVNVVITKVSCVSSSLRFLSDAAVCVATSECWSGH
jgi:hypothetical protein